MKIAICDDENCIISLIEGWADGLKSIYPHLECEVFYSGEELVANYRLEPKPYDIIFLDIEMTGMDGIVTAKQIRDFDKKVMIVYITSHQEYVYESFEVNAFRYLLKPILVDNFTKIIKIAYNKLKEQQEIFTFSYKYKTTRLYCDDIIYFESYKREVIVHTVEQIYKFYGKLKGIFKELNKDNFMLVHNSYLLNMEYIKEIDYLKIKLMNDMIIPISENKRKEVRNHHIKYLARRLDI